MTTETTFKVGDVVTNDVCKFVITQIEDRPDFPISAALVGSTIGYTMPFNAAELTPYAGSDLEWKREGRALYAAALEREQRADALLVRAGHAVTAYAVELMQDPTRAGLYERIRELSDDIDKHMEGK